MYTVRISTRAAKQIKKLPEKIQEAIIESFRELKDTPHLGKKLSRELSERFSYRISVYRIVYKINEKDKIVSILFAGHRGTVYD